jgi:hypothetical protein
MNKKIVIALFLSATEAVRLNKVFVFNTDSNQALQLMSHLGVRPGDPNVVIQNYTSVQAPQPGKLAQTQNQTRAGLYEEIKKDLDSKLPPEFEAEKVKALQEIKAKIDGADVTDDELNQVANSVKETIKKENVVEAAVITVKADLAKKNKSVPHNVSSDGNKAANGPKQEGLKNDSKGGKPDASSNDTKKGNKTQVGKEAANVTKAEDKNVSKDIIIVNIKDSTIPEIASQAKKAIAITSNKTESVE